MRWLACGVLLAACLAPDACLDILIGVAVAWLRWRSPWAHPSNH